MTPAIDAHLAHGYTLHQVHHLAKQAVTLAGRYATDYLDRWDAAHGAILIRLYETEHRPDWTQLSRTGAEAIHALVNSNLRTRGYPRSNGYHQPGSSPRFAAYWMPRITPSPEQRIVETTAIRQILPQLTPRETQAVAALAATDDYQQAADLLNLPYSSYCALIARARHHARTLWHEGETPVPIRDRRIGSRTATPPTECPRGHAYTPDNLASNGSSGGTRCKQCHRDNRAARDAGIIRPPRQLRPCGTYSAWQRHRRRGEPTDPACEAARESHNAAGRRPQAVAA